MAGKGGAIKGAGRKSKAEELKVATQAVSAITTKYGSPEAGFLALLESGEASLIKWVFEHAYGKPQDKVDVTTKGESINTPQEVIVMDYTKPK
jgi:hypothetical protein